jgi:hypothetical protein
VDVKPYVSDSGFSFQVADGTGTYDSATKFYQVEWCGAKYPGFAMDLGQATFNEIEHSVSDGGIWSVVPERDSACSEIIPERPGQFFRFRDARRSVTLDIRQCYVVPAAVQARLDAIRAAVRRESDKRKLHVPYECIAI